MSERPKYEIRADGTYVITCGRWSLAGTYLMWTDTGLYMALPNIGQEQALDELYELLHLR